MRPLQDVPARAVAVIGRPLHRGFVSWTCCLVFQCLLACGPESAPEVEPELALDLRFSPQTMVVGEVGVLEATVRVVEGRLPAGKELRLLLPHWWYGQRLLTGDERPHAKKPADARDVSFGRWYVGKVTDQPVGPGGELSLRIAPFIAPVVPRSDFEPIVLLGSEGASDHVRIENNGPPIQVVAGPPVAVVAVAPVQVAPGAGLSVRFRQEDSFGNPAGAPIPDRETTAPPGKGAQPLMVSVETGLGSRTLRAGLLLVESGPRRLVFADLHGHSANSDGAGSPDEWFDYARHVGFLDVAALSDHDWQLDPGEWQSGLAAAEAANTPGTFVALPAIETNLNGHEVIYFPDPSCLPGELVARRGATEIWSETDLRRRTATLEPTVKSLLSGCVDSALTVTHTSLASGMGTSFPVRPVPPNYSAIEVYSAHGSSECRGCPRAFDPGPGGEPVGSVREALNHHGPIAFLAAGDSHDGRPGNSRWGAWPGGLTGLWVKELTREGVVEAIRSGKTFATTGVRASLEIGVTPEGLRIRIVAPAEISEIVVVRNGVEEALAAAEQGRWIRWADPDPKARRWAYVRVTLADGSMLWASPVGPG